MATNIINLSSLDGINGFRMDGVGIFNRSGNAVSDAGDINGDGFDDVIIGTYYFVDPNGNGSGTSYIVFGKDEDFDPILSLSNLDGNDGFRINGAIPYSYSGRAVSSAGDFNGDGFDDLIIGAPNANPNGDLSGSSYIVFGKATGFEGTLNLSTLDGSNGFRLDGEATFNLAGLSVSSAGDINSDGFDDVIIGAPPTSSNGDYSGSSYVLFGKNADFSAVVNLSCLNGTNGFRIDGTAAFEFSGFTVSDGGDINGDGYGDVLVGAASASPDGIYDAGASYVVFGKASGFSSLIDLSNLDGSNGFRLDGTAEYDIAGTVSSAGDVNGDGYTDVIVGAYGADLNGDRSGSSYVVFGKASGFDATIELSSLDGSNGFRLDGASAFDFSGRSVSSAGDMNGDGYGDLLVGASGNYSGSSYVVFGKVGFNAVLNLSNLDSKSGVRLEGVAAADDSGRSVSNAGDVNGDGFGDLLVGAPGADPNSNFDSGSSYVVFGGDFNGKVTDMGTAGADKLKGSKDVDRMIAGNGDDVLSGRGGKDVFHAGAGDDTIEIRDTKFQLADGGAGLDTLTLDDSHLNLNLTKERGHISDIEAIDMKGSGSNKLTLTALDVLNLSTTSNTLIVDGNRNDRVAGLDSGWQDGGVHHGYHTFTNGEATLLVGVHVTVDFA